MGRIPLGISALISIFVAAYLSATVLYRASWLLPSDFDRNAPFVQVNGPGAGFLLLILGLVLLQCCRVLLSRFARQLVAPEASGTAAGQFHSRTTLLSAIVSKTLPFAACGVVAGLLLGAPFAWVVIAANGMGNGGDTSVVSYEVSDFIGATLLGLGLFLAAALSARITNVSGRP